MWRTYRARWHGDEYPASVEPMPDQLYLRLYRDKPSDGFEELAPDRYVRVVPAADCEAFLYVTTACEWRGETFQVVDDNDDLLLLEYVGGSAPVARQLQLEQVERGVYRAAVPREQVRGLRENMVVLSH